MVKFKNADEITKAFIKKGWNKNIKMSEFTEKEAKETGRDFLLAYMTKGKKYFIMEKSGNIFDDTGKIALFNFRSTSGGG